MLLLAPACVERGRRRCSVCGTPRSCWRGRCGATIRGRGEGAAGALNGRTLPATLPTGPKAFKSGGKRSLICRNLLLTAQFPNVLRCGIIRYPARQRRSDRACLPAGIQVITRMSGWPLAARIYDRCDPYGQGMIGKSGQNGPAAQPAKVRAGPLGTPVQTAILSGRTCVAVAGRPARP